MIYLVISSTGSYQLNSFNPHMVSGFTTDIYELLTEDFIKTGNSIKSIKERIEGLNHIHNGRSTFTYLPPVVTKADLLTTYPELFI